MAIVAATGPTAIAQQTVKATKASVCKDGTTSTVIGVGACNGHGGVDEVATKAAQKSAKAEKARRKADKAKLSKNSNKAAAAEVKAERAEAKAAKAEKKAASDATGATALCKDGTYSHTTVARGACSAHGGVAKALKP